MLSFHQFQVVLEDRGRHVVPPGGRCCTRLHRGQSVAKLAVHRVHSGSVEERKEPAVGNPDRVDRPCVPSIRRGS